MIKEHFEIMIKEHFEVKVLSYKVNIHTQNINLYLLNKRLVLQYYIICT